MQTRVSNRLMPNIKMQLPQGYKSAEGRRLFSNHLSVLFQESIFDIPEKTLSVKQLRDIFWQITNPLKPPLSVSQPEEDKIAHTSVDFEAKFLDENSYDHEMIYTGYQLYISTENDIITAEHPILIHEMRHIFDYMCQPKSVCARANKYIQRDYVNKFNEIINYIKRAEYRPKRILGIFKKHDFEEKLKERLKDLDNDFVIDLLQRARYTVKTEINAYKDTKCAIFMKAPFSIDNLLNLAEYHYRINNRFEFKEKKRVLEKLLREFIQKERASFVSA